MATEATKPCPRCGAVKPLSDFRYQRAQCKECRRVQMREWDAKNRNKRLAQKREWYAKNKDRGRALAREWKKKNKDKAAAANREWDAKNRNKRLAQKREWIAKNRDKELARKREWSAKNRDKVRAYSTNRTAQLAPGYVATTLGLRLKDMPPPLLEMKRQQLTWRRMARQLRKANHEISKDTD